MAAESGAAGLARTAVILASASPTRLAILRRAGVACEAVASAVDEDEIKAAMKADGADGTAIAETLARLKAQSVARRSPGRLTIGADQVLDCEGKLWDKPPDRAAAKAQLRALAGRMHALITAAVVVEDGREVWHHTGRARLWMRGLSEGFIDAYLDAAGDDVLGSVGAYRLEGLGANLFARIEGDWFGILGLPLLPLLDYLRAREAMRA